MREIAGIGSRLAWLAQRSRREWIAPTRGWTAAAVNAVLDLRDGLTGVERAKARNPIAVYDLRVCPITFDFPYYLYDAETYFRERGFDRFAVYILNMERWGHGAAYDAVIDAQKRRARIGAMLVPMAEMYQGCSSVTVLDTVDDLVALCRANAPVFPRHADGINLRTHRYADIYRKLRARLPYSGFRAPQGAIDQARRFKARHGITQPTVTLTVRAYSYQPLRNTVMDVYFAFADYLRTEGFTPIFIPDADAPHAVDFRDFLSFEDACTDLCLRTAIYEESFTNIFTSNGVHVVAAFDNSSAFMTTILNEAYPESTGLKRWESEGLNFGDQPFGGTTKHFIWAKESFENLRAHFDITRSHRSVERPAEAKEFS